MLHICSRTLACRYGCPHAPLRTPLGAVSIRLAPHARFKGISGRSIRAPACSVELEEPLGTCRYSVPARRAAVGGCPLRPSRGATTEWAHARCSVRFGTRLTLDVSEGSLVLWCVVWWTWLLGGARAQCPVTRADSRTRLYAGTVPVEFRSVMANDRRNRPAVCGGRRRGAS